MIRARALALACLCLVCVCVCAGEASAQPAAAQAVGAPPAAPKPTAADAKARLAEADKHYAQKELAEAYQAYDDVLRTYAAFLGYAQKRDAEKRLKELAPQTGNLALHVNESGASVSVDGKSLGTTPLAPLVRVTSGPHRVLVVKDGFLPFDQSKDVPSDGTAAVDVVLAKEPTTGHLVVREANGVKVRVVVDGLDRGEAPWEGDVDPGKHEVILRSSAASSPAQTVDVTKGQRTEVELVVVGAAGHLEVHTSDGLGVIYVDGKVVGEGNFTGDVPVGSHAIVVSREGFTRFEKTVTFADKQSDVENVTLERPLGAIAQTTGEAARPLEGIYGGVGLLAAFGLGQMGTELDTNCATLGASTCNTPSPDAGGLFGYVGYTWDPIGFEFFLAGSFDTTQQTASFTGSSNPTENPLFNQPTRNEAFTFYRFGGLGAVRVRATTQGRLWRASAAAGLGLAYRKISVKRVTTSTDGQNLTDTDISDLLDYLSPAITADLAVHWRISQKVALGLGVLFWAENAGDGVQTSPDPTRRMTNGTVAVPLATPAYHLAQGSQVFLGPYIGVEFGP